MGGRVGLLEGREALQGDLHRRQRWAKDNGTSFCKSKPWFLHFGHNHPQQCYGPGEKWLESCSGELGGVGLL